MAKLQGRKFHFVADSGEELSFESDVSVNNDGVFSVTIPEELQDSCTVVINDDLIPEMNYRSCTTGRRTRSSKTVVTSRSMEQCCKIISVAAKHYLKCETKTERVIVYGMEMQLAAWKDENGDYKPNGYCKGDTRSGKWLGGKGAECFCVNANHQTEFYKVGIIAYVCDKTTYMRQNHTRTVYEKVQVHFTKDDSWLEKLNSFVGIQYRDPSPYNNIKEIPYSEAAARFFYDAMIGLCALADRVFNFLNDEKKLIGVIADSNRLLPGT